MPTPLDASVIVCTYNRADSLVGTLEALRAQVVPAGLTWEVIVVDNNSRDHTRAIVERFAKDWPLLHYRFEAQQGLSHARNHGVAAARGNVLLFTDDDVKPEADWVERIVAGIAAFDADACGGYIAPIWESPPPAWLTARFHGFLAVRMEEQSSYVIDTAARFPYGANMAFRRIALERAGPFDTNRGRKGATLASGEDGDMFERLHAAGAKLVFLHDARVHHRVESFRVRKGYFRRWRRQTSLNTARSRGMPGERRVLGIPWYIFPQFIRALSSAVVARLREPPDEAFFREILVWHFVGTMQGLFRARQDQ